jgi:hypothetical protein
MVTQCIGGSDCLEKIAGLGGGGGLAGLTKLSKPPPHRPEIKLRHTSNVVAKFIWQTEMQTIGEKGNS